MKHLYLIGGTMGVGKTATGQALKNTLDKSVFLDGDWCWDMHPFVVNEETKALVMDNIVYLLSSFLRSSAFDHIIFSWVMHEQQIIDDLLARLQLEGCTVHTISLVCTPEALTERINQDIASGLRTTDVLERSMKRLPLYNALDTIKIDSTSISVNETAREILIRTLSPTA